MPDKKGRRKLWLILFAFVIPSCCVAYAAWVLSPFWLDDLILRRAIKPYPSATPLFEDFGHVWASASETTLFYWTPDSREAVEDYFEMTLSAAFARSDEKDNWIITSYQLNGENPAPSRYRHVTHEAVCSTLAPHDSEEFKCISISLLRADQPDLCLLPIVSSGDRYMMQATPYWQCARIPKTGTLIIYKYHLSSM